MVPASTAQPIPTNLNQLLPFPKTPWNLNAGLFARIRLIKSEQPFKTCDITNNDPEYNFLLRYFEKQKPVGFTIKRVVCIHNPSHSQIFENTLKNMELEAQNPYFKAKGKEEEPSADRQRVLDRWETQVKQFSPIEILPSTSRSPDICFKAKVLPMWHGSSQDVCRSVCQAGFTYFGKQSYFNENATKGGTKNTDKGYFGSGIYFTNSAQYAAKYSSDGHLILAWVSMREPYPVVNDQPHPQKGSDMLKLEGHMHYQNYNAHFIPVAPIDPNDPKCVQYFPCYKNQMPVLDELVVFEKAQTLPRFWVELVVDFPNIPIKEQNQVTEGNASEKDSLDELLKKFLDSNLSVKPMSNPMPSAQNKPFRHSTQIPAIQKTSDSKPISESPGIIAKISAGKLSENFQVPAEDEYQKGLKYENEDEKQAFHFFNKAALMGHTEALYKLGVCYKKGKGVVQNLPAAFECFKKVANLNHPSAQCDLGVCYANGQGVALDMNQAVWWYQKAASQGHPSAQRNLGVCYEYGQGVTKNVKEAILWYQKAASKNHILAQYNLGLCYAKDTSDPQNLTNAFEMFYKAAEQNFPEAQYEVGNCYMNGLGVEKDATKALEFYTKAAFRKLPEAQFKLGMLYKVGEGVIQNFQEAVINLEKAAEQGHTEAQYNLGVCYSLGQGVTQDTNTAINWYLLAAEKGHSQAQYELGVYYLKNPGMKPNFEEAKKWLLKAAEEPNPNLHFSGEIYYELGSHFFQTGIKENPGASGSTGNQVMTIKNRKVSTAFEFALKLYQIASYYNYVPALYAVGLCFEKGYGTAKDLSKAFKWYQQAAHRGNIDAQYLLGLWYKDGTFVKEDFKESAKWFQKAAEQNHAEASYYLGCFFEFGLGKEQDNSRAFKHYYDAAKLGHSAAQYEVGKHYYFKTDRERAEATDWLEKASGAGQADAQYLLANLYLEGKDTTKNLMRAKDLLIKAASQGHKKARELHNREFSSSQHLSN